MKRAKNHMVIKQLEYKNAELILCEFIATQPYDIEDPEAIPPTYKDFTLQEFHNYVAKQIEETDLYLNSRYEGMKKKK